MSRRDPIDRGEAIMLARGRAESQANLRAHQAFAQGRVTMSASTPTVAPTPDPQPDSAYAEPAEWFDGATPTAKDPVLSDPEPGDQPADWF